MSVHRTLARTGTVLGGGLALLALAAPSAPAHPLGNFSVNHYVGLTVHPDGIDVLAVTDLAEIPTLQEQPEADPDHNGNADRDRLTAWADRRCAETARRTRLTTEPGGDAAEWTVTGATFHYQDGSAGLPTSRLECRLHTPTRLPTDGSTFRLVTGADPTRVGWNEITARGDGATVDRSDVPVESVSQELRAYPRDLLDSPRGVTEATFRARPGGGSTVGKHIGRATSGPAAWLADLDSRLARMGAADRLTWPIGLLAVLLSIVLGAGHALLPGHGKTVMAAYLAGRRGSRRDALTVGATVTLTHTAGVLATGLLLTAFSSLAGDTLLGWLGVGSGVLVMLLGVGLLRDAVRSGRRDVRPLPAPTTPPDSQPILVAATVPPAADPGAHVGAQAAHDHHRAHAHDHAHHDDPHHDHPDGHTVLPHRHHAHDHDHEPHRHRHGLFGHDHHHGPGPQRPGRRTLIGLGVAGGLVPSPSALVVLLGAVALGRTLFGVALVLAYGLGMAATLTGAGLLLLGVGDRLTNASHTPVLARLRRLAPYTGWPTALLVLTVGLGMVLRSLPVFW